MDSYLTRTSTLFRRLYMFPYSSYMDMCCKSLESEHEYESDTFLVALIRLQKVHCKTMGAFPIPESDQHGNAPHDFSAASQMVMSTFRMELEALRSEIPWDLQTHCECSPSRHQPAKCLDGGARTV
jgi:hypothetical protein